MALLRCLPTFAGDLSIVPELRQQKLVALPNLQQAVLQGIVFLRGCQTGNSPVPGFIASAAHTIIVGGEKASTDSTEQMPHVLPTTLRVSTCSLSVPFGFNCLDDLTWGCKLMLAGHRQTGRCRHGRLERCRGRSRQSSTFPLSSANPKYPKRTPS